MSPEVLLIKNGLVVTKNGQQMSSVLIKNGRIEDINDSNLGTDELDCTIIDASGCYVTPGLIDLQVNGSPKCNLWADPSANELEDLRRQMIECGVTSFLPTLITDDIDHLNKNISFLNANGVGMKETNGETDLARMPGIHLEGPFLSAQRPGVHPPQHIKPLNLQNVKQVSCENVKLMTVAPETDVSGEAIDWLMKQNIEVSLGHSNADLNQAQSAFDRGVKLVTHLFNAMPPLHHRSPGAVGATFLDDKVTACIIADGLHLSADAVKLIYKIKGPDKTILVTDIATVGTKDGGLVGSSITLDQAVLNMVSWNVCDFATAIKMASTNPAKAVHLDSLGSIEKGKLADMLIWDKNSLKLKNKILGGKLLA
ncbi:MAG: N-acetylglucosamine-6-phosphate deacetylase [Candidatus Melainabacteria bacterium]|nr:N-acetylglucosamine-6-phosphate deacetylase [Candidatus Melainabacteria bacterium]